MTLNSEDEKSLKDKRGITKTVDVSITDNGTQKEFWPLTQGRDFETLNVWANKSNKQVSIKLTRVPDYSGTGIYAFAGSLDKELTCTNDGLSVISRNGGVVYGRKNRLTKGKGNRVDVTKKLNITISVPNCTFVRGQEKTTCPLKVVNKQSIEKF